MYSKIILSVIIGYLLGSIPFALVIGKLFFRTDIRQHGSKNLGGGNAGRVLGKKAGLAVMALDLLKVTLVIFIVSCFQGGEWYMTVAGLAAAAGHCFPLFANFKGGKAVAVMYGFLFGMALFGGYSLWIFLLPLISFLVILYLGKIIALASIFSAMINTVYLLFTTGNSPVFWASLIFSAVILVRHKSNLMRIRQGIENKITWM